MNKIKNAIIINGVTYELVKHGHWDICGQCDLLNLCMEQRRIFCNIFPLPDKIQYHFKKVDAKYEYTKERKEIEIPLKD